MARFLRRDLAGQRVGSTALQDRFPAADFDGEELLGTDAWGKHLFVRFESASVHVHLGLFGRFRRLKNPADPPRGALRWRLEGEGRTWDLSGPTACDVIDPASEEALLDRLGPDPLRRDADVDAFVATASKSRMAIGALLLDQAKIAGVGNVYRAEICFLHGVHPERPSKEVGEHELRAIWGTCVELLGAGERIGRIVTTYEALDLAPRDVPRYERLHVYKRRTCRRCESEIVRTELANRTCYHCPVCQAA